MEHYNMTHTTMKLQSHLARENTVDVATTPSKELEKSGTTGKSDTTIALQQRGNIAFLETLAEVLTPQNNSAEEAEPTSVMLLYRIGEALQAAERTHDSISKKQQPDGFVDNEAKVKGGIASFVQLVKSVNQGDSQLDFEAAMDWLRRESKTGKPLIIDLTRQDNNDSRSDDSSTSSEHSRYDSDYMDGGDDSKPRHKKRTSHNKQKNLDEDDCPPDGNTNLNILSSAYDETIEMNSHNDGEEISVNESNECNNNLPGDLFNVLYGESTHHDKVEDEGGQGGQQHREKSGGLEENELYGKSPHHDKVDDDNKSGGLGERHDSDEDDEVEDDGVQEGQQHRDSGKVDEVEDEGVQDRQQH